MSSRRKNNHSQGLVAAGEPSPGIAIGLGIFLILATFVTFFPATRAGYIWDDDCLVYQNPEVTKPEGMYSIWFNTRTPDYWPLTSTTFWLEWQIWGDNPTSFHVTNIALHTLAAVILWRILIRLNLSHLAAFLGALLFAVHPVSTASAAWIAERKNVLSMALYLLAVLAFLRFEDARRPAWYVFALCATVISFLSKTSAIALPIILLLLAWWRRNTITRQDVIRTLPFFMLSLVFGLMTVMHQHDKIIDGVPVRPEGIASRIASVGWVFWFYLYKLILPIDLAMIYPRWDINGSHALSFIPLTFMLLGLFILWYYRKGWSRGPLVALGSFTIVLAPVLGLLNMSYSRMSLAADHLQYPGMPGVTALAGGLLAAGWSWLRHRNSRLASIGFAVLSCAIVLTLSTLSWRYSQVFKDEQTLWNHTLQTNPRCWVAYNNLGNFYGLRGDIHLAIENYTKAIQMQPDYTQPYNNRAAAYFGLGAFDKAWADVKSCRQRGGTLTPGFVEALAKYSGRTE